MKLRLPHALCRALMACFAALASTSLASASVSAPCVEVTLPDIEQADSMLCWAASAADMLALRTGHDAGAIYSRLTAASGNAPGYVESALSWYMEGAEGEFQPQRFDGSHTITRHGFASLESLAASLDEALATSRAASAMLYAGEEGVGHAITVYGCRFEDGRLFLSYADSADGVQGVRRSEVVASGQGLVLAGTPYVLRSITFLGEEDGDVAPTAPVGAYMHSSPLLQEYTDMAENRGVYRFGAMPSMITYRNGEADYVLMVTPDFSSVADAGCFTLVNNGSFQLTVEHNGIMTNASFTGRFVGDYAQQYSGVGIRYNSTFVFGWSNPFVSMNEDYKVERVSRLVTDASSAYYCTDTSVLSSLNGETLYRMGAGNSGWYDTAGNINGLVSAWGAGLTAGVTQQANSYLANGDDVYNVEYSISDYGSCSADNALPSVGQPGDSGSPIFYYNEEEGRFEFVGPLQGANDTFCISRYNPSATTAAIDYCTVNVATAVDYEQGNDSTIYYISGAKVGEDDVEITDGDATTYLRKGNVTLNGQTVASYNGVALEEFSQGTWKLLDADSLTWYTYSDSDYINALPDVATGADTFGTDDLFYTSNLTFVADAAEGTTTANRRIELTENVDLGVGHVQFSLGEGTSSATWDIGQASSDYYLSSAGFVVDKGVTVNNYFTYEKGRELRRVGEGVMNLVGTGNSDVLLNIGGGGVTYLNRTDGYAAYSALVNSGAVLRLADVGQVYNNVTLGANGGVLDFNGNDYCWASGGARSGDSFGLTVYEGLNRVETSVLANYAEGTTATITITRAEDFEFAGAFRDGSTYTGSGAVEMDSRYTMMPSALIAYYNQYAASARQDSTSTLRVIYDGGSTMSLTGVYTILTGDSGFEVASGTVSLHGTNTIHAIGSETGTNANRWQNSDDWHYAMAEMNVQVDNGATFELGDHALLLGNVSVEQGGSFVMKQAVNARHEYVEGWYVMEDTYALADYYGLKGDVSLAAGADMAIRFDEGISTSLGYGGSISGAGSLTVDAGEGSVYLTGANSVSGEKTVASGHLRLATGAEGDTSTNKWKVQAEGSLALESLSNNAQLESLVDASSTGVLALTRDFAQQVCLRGLIVGAAEGESAHYGSSLLSLEASAGQWTLGGGGGTLYVDFLLEGGNKLVLGNAYGAGTVVLTNADNSFSGGIETVGAVSLGYTNAGALGSNVLNIGYGSSVAGVDGAAFASDNIDSSSQGVFALSDGAQVYDFSAHGSLSLGAYGEAVLTGGLTVAEGAAYRFGGAGVLTIATALAGSHGIVIDGQGSSGTSVTFATASADTGAVVVQGYDADKADSGDVTLSFTTDNALAAASSVVLRHDAGVDLNGTNQTFHNISGEAGSLIFDDRGGNTLILNNTENSTLSAGVQAVGTAVVKTGSGTLVLGGENLWQSLTIGGGTVQVGDSKSLGYLAPGSQGIAVNVNAGGTLHLTQGMSFANVLNIAGAGADGASYALKADGLLNNSAGTLNVVDDAAVSGQFSFLQLNLQGNTLTVKGSGSSFSAAGISDGTLSLTEGASLNLGSYKMGAGVTLELDNATINVANGSLAGEVRVGANGATINYPWNNTSTGAFNLTGLLSGTSSDSTLQLVGYKHIINLSGGVELEGKLEVGNGLTLNITQDASVGALVNESNVGDLSTVVVNAATLELTGSGNNFGSNGNPGTISLTNGGQLKLTGLAEGASMGALGTLDLGTDGVLTLTSLAGYGSHALMHIGALEGTGSLSFDVSELGSLAAGTYHILTSGSDLAGLATLPSGMAGGRRDYSLASGGADGTYSLDLVVGEGSPADVSWAGTGTLIAGTANETNITTNLATDDHTFMAMDALTITTDGDSNTLTLGGGIYASTVTYTGAGTMVLAQQDGGAIAAGTTVVVEAEGAMDLGSTTAIQGKVELRKGTLSASGTALNATEGITVGTGDAGTLVLTTDDAVTTAINIDGTLTVDSQQSQNGRQLQGNLSGEGTLVKTNSGKLNLVGNHSAFSGHIDVQNGTLQLGTYTNGVLDSFSIKASSVNMAEGTSLVLQSATAEYGADFTWGDNTRLYVTVGTGDGPSPSSIGYTFSGRQTLNGTLQVQSQWGKVAHISGDIEGEGALNFTSTNNGGGSPAFVLSGNNTYSGGTTVDFANFSLYAAGQNALGTGTVTLKNGTLAWTGVGNGWNGDLTASAIVVSGGELNTKGYDVTYSGTVSGSEGSLTKSGAGTLTLSQYAYTGQTHVAAGTLEIDPYYATVSTSVSGDAGATFRLNSEYSGNIYLMGNMSGELHLELRGHYGLSAANTHTGGTELLSGSLQIGNVNALQSGSLYAHEGTTVSVVLADTLMTGSNVVDALAFESGASVVLGTGDGAAHLSFGSLSGTASFLLDIFSADSYDSLSGTLTPGSLLSVNLAASELGSYLLVAGDNSGVDTSGFTYSGNTNSEYIYLWNSSERGITLSIEDASIAADANVWTGGSNGTWDAGTDTWYGNSYSAEKSTLILAHDTTTIGVAAAVSATTLTTEVDEGVSLQFLSNGGSITATTLQKDGEGTLSFASGSSNSFGSVVVNGGVLSVADSSALGTTKISGEGTFELTGGSMTARLHDHLTVKNLRITNGAALTFTSDTSNGGGSTTGRLIEIIGSGSSLSMTQWSNLNASTVILRDGGTVCSGDNGFGNNGGTIYVDGAGVIKYGNTGGGNVAASISGTGTLTVQDWNAGHWVSFNGVIADDAQASAPLALALSQNYVVMTAANTYSGGTTISGGTVIANTESSLGRGSLHMTGGTLTMETTFRGTTYSTDLSIGSLSGTAGTIAMGSNDLSVNQTDFGSFSGTITGTGTLTKTGAGTLQLSGNNSMGAMQVQAGTLAYDAGSSSTLGAVSGDGTFALVGGAVNASNISVGRLEVTNAVLTYSNTFDGKVLEVSGQGAELRMGHWASVNNSSLLLKDGGQLSMSSSGFSGSTVTVEGSGAIAVGQTASADINALLNVNSVVTGNGTLYVKDYGSVAYTTNFNREISDAAGGSLALSANQSDLHFTVANSYTGGTTINGGKLTAEVEGALGTGAVTLNGGELIANANGSIGSGAVTINGGTLSLELGSTAQLFYIDNLSGTGGAVNVGANTLVINQAQNGGYDGSFSGSGSITKRGDAMLELGGSAEGLGLQIDSGTVKLVDSDVFADTNGMTTSVVTLYGGSFDINGQTTGTVADSFMFDVDSGYLAFRGDSRMLVTDSSGRADSGLGFNTTYAYTGITHWGTGEAEIAANIISGGNGGAGDKIKVGVQSSGALIISGDIGADHSVAEHHQFGISKVGTGTMVLSGDNGYTGGTSVEAGTLIAASDTALGSGALIVANGAALEIEAGHCLSLAGDITLAGGSSLTLGSVDASAASLATSGAVTLGGALSLTVNGELAAGNRYMVLGGDAGLTLGSGIGGITLSGQAGYRYTAGLEVEGNTLYLVTSSYEGTTLTWNNGDASVVWKGGTELWEQSDGANVGSGSEDSVVFGESGTREVSVDDSGVRVDSLTVSADGYSFSGGTVHAESATLERQVELASGATLNLGNAYTVSQRSESAAANIGPVEMGAEYIQGRAEGGLSALDYAVIDISKGATLVLRDLLITENSRITDDPATVSMENVTIALAEANTTIGTTSTLNEGAVLAAVGSNVSFSVPEDASVLAIFSTALDTVNVTGSSLTLDLNGLVDSIGEAWQSNAYVAVSFGQSAESLAHFDTTGLSISATYGGSSYAVYVNQAERSAASTLYISTTAEAIPEPTTATLSLLALSLLAARRRRK